MRRPRGTKWRLRIWPISRCPAIVGELSHRVLSTLCLIHSVDLPTAWIPANCWGTTTNAVQYDFSQGHFDQTKRPLDLALHGDGFFTVQGPDGPLYTRNGSFYVDANRQLVTIDNLPVMGPAGPIVLPQQVNSENIDVSRDGRLSSNGQEFGQLELVKFQDNSVLTPAGSSLFSASANAGPTAIRG